MLKVFVEMSTQGIKCVRILTQSRFVFCAVAEILDRHDPLRRPLKEIEMAHLVDQRAGNLDRCRARINDTDPFACKFNAVVPSRTVKTRAGKTVHAWNIGHLCMMQNPGRRNDYVSFVFASG